MFLTIIFTKDDIYTKDDIRTSIYQILLILMLSITSHAEDERVFKNLELTLQKIAN